MSGRPMGDARQDGAPILVRTSNGFATAQLEAERRTMDLLSTALQEVQKLQSTLDALRHEQARAHEILDRIKG